MNFWDKITGNDMSKALKTLILRAKQLPADYQNAWDEIKANSWGYSDFTGRNLMPILMAFSTCWKPPRRTGKAPPRCWATTSRASAPRWPAKKAQKPIATNGASSWNRAVHEKLSKRGE